MLSIPNGQIIHSGFRINLHQINAQVSLEGSSEGRKDIHQEPVVPSPVALSREIKNRTVIDEGTDISSGRITAGT